MKGLFLLLVVVGATSMAFAQSGKSDGAALSPPGLRDLAWLTGRWEFEDRAVTASDTYAEKGTRQCEWALDEQYIRCESRGVINGRARTYVFYFNWNKLDNRFEMVALHGNYPRKTFFTIKVSEQGRRLDLLSEKTTRDGIASQSWGTIRYDGQDKLSWETRINRSDQPPDSWNLLYREESRRFVPSVEPK
ncbi:MAG: hypothetical protein ACKV2V_10535 [Blastocatellia bacterium]